METTYTDTNLQCKTGICISVSDYAVSVLITFSVNFAKAIENCKQMMVPAIPVDGHANAYQYFGLRSTFMPGQLTLVCTKSIRG